MRSCVIVDDDKIIRKDIIQSVNWKRIGFLEPFQARNGQEGLDLIMKIKPSLVIADIMMPGMNGIEMIRIARRYYADAHYLVLSNYDDYQYMRGALINGVIDYIMKIDFSEDVLIDAILRMNLEKDDSTNESDDEQSHNTEVAVAIDYIESYFSKQISLQEIADQVHLSRNYFCRLFKRSTGITFLEYQNKVRMERAMYLLDNTSLSISEIAENIGFGDANYFKRMFERLTGLSPTRYRKRGD